MMGHGAYSYLITETIPNEQAILFDMMIHLDAEKGGASLVRLLLIIVGTNIVWAIVATLSTYYAVQWRAAITAQIHDRLFVGNRLYRLECVDRCGNIFMDNYF